jgi:hypothetical protein
VGSATQGGHFIAHSSSQPAPGLSDFAAGRIDEEIFHLPQALASRRGDSGILKLAEADCISKTINQMPAWRFSIDIVFT